MTMNSRERVRVSLSHKQPDRAPRGFFADAVFMGKLRSFLGVADDDEALESLQIDLRHVEPIFVGPQERSGGLHHTDKAFPDFWGVPRKLVKNEYGVYSEIAGYPLADAITVSEIEAYPWPKQEWFDTSTIGEQLANADRAEPRWINYHRAGKLFELAWTFRGMEQGLLDLVVNPGLVQAILDQILAFYIELAKRVIQAGGGRIDMVTIGDDVGTQRGMMISPEVWRNVIKPYLRKLIKAFHEMSVKVMYHSCGSIIPIIEDLIEIGVDVLEPLQPKADGMDPAFLKSKYGDRLCFHGGIDEQDLLPHGSPEQVKQEVEQTCKTLGRNGGYIVMAAHAFQPDIPCENIVAMYEAVDKAHG